MAEMREELQGSDYTSIRSRLRVLEYGCIYLNNEVRLLKEKIGTKCTKLGSDSVAEKENDKEALIFLHELSIANLNKGGNGEIPQQAIDFIKSCYKNGITFQIEVK